jgi:hypothetical protein
MSGDCATDTCRCIASPIALGRKHFEQLPVARDQWHQFTALRVRNAARWRPNKISELSQHLHIDSVRFRQATSCSGKAPVVD